ncbi:NADP-dependent oxidoreductase [Periweissella fabalis]|uniref:NADP-dependent oxidoreductase n=1 Tax=Periweissella fabalis TaxID=1070421 RepID=A0A7X6N3B4_9LACO|nr:NADP-dependent oxidoreductase [Periweissella fabalis]MCM0598410.1 NADP-dependent oxidoreductase [Periweissella fabalis]NKZ23967.1 NADP-dependent oxidoreductase [Periweissella fabalis]
MEMEAYVLREFGDLAHLVEISTPEPTLTPKQVLVRQCAIAIEPYDVAFCAGQTDGHVLPVIPGSSVAGEIVAVGDAVTGYHIGERVVASRYLKTYGEYVPVNQRELARIPAEMSYAQAVSLAVSGQTAYQMIRHYLQPMPNQKILIHGGMGNVGRIAIQLAQNTGAQVYTTASTANVAKLSKLPDIIAIDYTKTSLAEFGVEFDLILDTIGGQTLKDSLVALKSGGKLVSIVDEPNTQRPDITATQEFLTSSGADLEALLNMIVNGVLMLPPIEVVPMTLANVRVGHELVGSGHYDRKYVLVYE